MSLLVALLACSGPRSASELPATPPAPREPVSADGQGEVPAGLPVDPGDTPAVRTPEEAYAACRERVEGPEAAGECTTDADCVKVGCSSEVCVATARAPEVMTTCEVLPCFRALDTCGCHEGVCSWTLVHEMPHPGKIELPVQ